MPSIAASCGSSFSSARGSPRSLPYEVEFSLTSTSSRTPVLASHSASASISSGVRETNAPRNDGIAQNAHRRSQPLASFSEATGPVSSRRRSTCRRWAGVCASHRRRVGAVPGQRHRRLAPLDRGERQQFAAVARGVRVDLLAGQHRGRAGRRCPGSRRSRAPRAASGRLSASSRPYRSAMQPAATTLAPVSAAASSVSIESCLAFSTNPQVLTTTTSAPSPSVVTCQPSASQPGGQLLGVDLVAGAAQRQQRDPSAVGGRLRQVTAGRRAGIVRRGGGRHHPRVPGAVAGPTDGGVRCRPVHPPPPDRVARNPTPGGLRRGMPIIEPAETARERRLPEATRPQG